MDPNPYESPNYPLETQSEYAPLVIEGQPLSVEFDLTLDDYVAFNLAYVSWRRLRLVILIIVGLSVPIGVAAYLIAGLSVEGEPVLELEEVVFLLFWAVTHFFVFAALMFWKRLDFGQFIIASTIKWMVTAGDTSSIFGHYRLTFSAERLHEQGPKNETSYNISAVQKLRVTDQHLFIYVSPLQAYIVPRRAYASPHEFEVLVRTLEKWTQLRTME